MIGRILSFKPSVKAKYRNKPPGVNHIAANNNGDGVTHVSTQALIRLRRAAQNLSIKVPKVRALQSGHYYSLFKGRGMEFDEVRPYQPGDDVRTIDWRVTARTGKPHTKLFREERERAVILWVDYRSSMFFATQRAFKSVLATKAAALFAWMAAIEGDRLGGLLFSDSGHEEFRPQRGKLAVLHFLKKLASHSSRQFAVMDSEDENKVDKQQALLRLRRVARPGSLIILISDFYGFDEQMESHLANLAKHNDVALLYTYDPLECELPPAGSYRVSDERNTVSIDTSNKKTRDQYQQRFMRHLSFLEIICLRYKVRFVPCSTADDIQDTLKAAFGLRMS